MGNDGGSIPTRRELVKEAARNPTIAEIKESQAEQQGYLWSTDPISREPLLEPIVSDSSGRLYNKSTILEFLVEGARKEDVEKVTHGAIKSLKDIVEVKFDADAETTPKVWKCPVTGDKLGPGSKAVYIVPCGHAFSGSAIKEISAERCMTCETAYAANDVIPIIPMAETDIARLTLRVKTLQERGLAHSLKKVSGSKKRKKQEAEADEKPKFTSAEREAAAKINNASTASLTAKVLLEQEKLKKRKTNDNLSSLFTSKDASKNLSTNADFMTRGFSVPAGKR